MKPQVGDDGDMGPDHDIIMLVMLHFIPSRLITEWSCPWKRVTQAETTHLNSKNPARKQTTAEGASPATEQSSSDRDTRTIHTATSDHRKPGKTFPKWLWTSHVSINLPALRGLQAEEQGKTRSICMYAMKFSMSIRYDMTSCAISVYP